MFGWSGEDDLHCVDGDGEVNDDDYESGIRKENCRAVFEETRKDVSFE